MSSILVVDDEPLVRELIRTALEAVGHTVDEAENGLIALECLDRRSFDLVITDIMMPEKEGIETMREIRKRCPNTRILAISGGGRAGGTAYLSLASKLGADEVLGKPFRTAQLLDVVARVLA